MEIAIPEKIHGVFKTFKTISLDFWEELHEDKLKIRPEGLRWMWWLISSVTLFIVLSPVVLLKVSLLTIHNE